MAKGKRQRGIRARRALEVVVPVSNESLTQGVHYARRCNVDHAETRAIIAAQRLVESFRSRFNNINCLEITDIDKSSSNMQMIIN